MKIRRIAMDAVLGVLVTIVLFGLFELIFLFAGMGEPASSSVSRGFDSQEVLFQPDPDVEGGFLPRIFGGEVPERPIPPKGEAKRVILFGGSNTRSFQHGRLPQAFEALAGPGGYEVVNLGRSGYGSGRVKVIFDQALELLEPDIVVLYTGHNELTEAGFAMELDEQWSSSWMKTVGALANRSRTVNVLAQSFAPEPKKSDSQDDGWQSQYKKFTRISYDQTQRFFEEYDKNLRAMCASALERGVGLVLSTVIYNRWAMPHASNFPAEISEQDLEQFRGFHRRAVAKLPDCITALLTEEGRDQDRVHYFDWGKTRRAGLMGPEGMEWEPLPGLRPSLGALKDQPPLWGTSKLWKPKIKEHYQALEVLHARRGDPALRQQLEVAAKLLKKALAHCADHPRALFELALVEYLLEVDEQELRARFESAASFDRAPRKSSEVTNDIVRKIAADLPEVVFFQADELFAERDTMGMVGWEWMTDHCHLNAGARRVLMRDLAALIVEHFGS